MIRFFIKKYYEKNGHKKMVKEELKLRELAHKRRSPRAYNSRPVESDKLEQLFETARWAPSSMNEQPWRFFYTTKKNPEAYNRFLDSLKKGNRIWAQNAHVLLSVFARKTYENNGSIYRHSWYDTGQAMGMLILQATELGLSVHQIGGFYADKIKEVVGISDEYEPVIMATIGYDGDLDKLPEYLRIREMTPRSRKEMKELAHPVEWHSNN